MLKATGGKRDGDAMIAAAKGYSWQSPRGPLMIDPQTREAVQNFYVTKVEQGRRHHGQQADQDLSSASKDPWHELHPPTQ